MLTQKTLKEALHYNQHTGIFTRLISNRSRAKIGDIAGYINSLGYVAINVYGKKQLAHRLAFLYMTGEMPKDQVDHINGIKSDNRISNLRQCKQSDNQKNVATRKDNKSGFKGVVWHKASGKWEVNATLNGKNHYLGRYDNIKVAEQSYKNFAKKHHGDFLHLTLK